MKSLPPIAATLAIVLVLLAGDFGACLTMGERIDWLLVNVIERQFTSEWARQAFRPAAWIEGKLRGVEVQATYQSPERRLEIRWKSAVGH